MHDHVAIIYDHPAVAGEALFFPFFLCLERISSMVDLASASIMRSLVPVQIMK